MPKKRYKAEQVIPILREVEKGSISIEKVLRKYGIKEPTYYRWRKKYGGMDISDAQEKRRLEKENRELKQLAGEQALVIKTLQQYAKKKGWI